MKISFVAIIIKALQAILYFNSSFSFFSRKLDERPRCLRTFLNSPEKDLKNDAFETSMCTLEIFLNSNRNFFSTTKIGLNSIVL